MGGRPRRWLFGGLAAAAALIVVARALAQLYVDFAWYASLGASALWWLKAENVVLLKGASLLVGGAFIHANLFAVRRSVASVILPGRVGDLEIAEEVSARAISRAVLLASLVLAALLTVPSDRWTSVAAVRLGVPFGESDPRFQSDLGFWIYWLPLEQALYARAVATLGVVIAVVVFVYALTPSLRWDAGALHVSPHARRHLSVLSGCVLLLLAWSYRLDAFEALLGERGAAGGWSWVDHNVHVPARVAMSVGAGLGAALVALTGWSGQVRLAFAAATGVLALSLVLGQAAPAVAERATRGADLAERELPYAATRAAYTRRAFAADRVEPATAALSFATPAAAAAGTPVWDPAVFVRAAERTRRLGVVEGRPALSAAQGAPVLSAAERPAGGAGGAAESRAWAVVRAAATDVGARGEIVGTDGSPLGEDDAARALPVLVHDSARGYLFVEDSAGAIASIDAASPVARWALALSQQNLRLVGTPGAPRAVLRRELRDRVRRLAPFFEQGATVTSAAAGDTLYWLVHLYSASATYPVSRPVPGRGWRYLRHAGVAVVNGYSGRVSLALTQALDPVARSWVNAVPGAFVGWAELPAEIQRAVPPPLESVLAQASAYAEFGERGDDVAPARSVRLPAQDTSAAGAATPLVLLPVGGGTPSLSLPVNDASGRLAGLVLGVGGPNPVTAWLAIAPPVAEPSYETVVDRLRRGLDVEAAGRGERVVPGAERVVPVGGAAAYVLPHYADRGDAAPLLAGVTTYYAGRYAQGATASAALAPGASTERAPATPPGADPASATGLARARELYDEARAALREGDWAAFGRAYDALGAALGPRRP